MNILPTPKGMPSILLARQDKLDADRSMKSAEAAGAWETWRKSIPGMAPSQVTRVIADAGLRGRGGAGFPTAAKWRAAAAIDADVRYVV
ncbi:MAG: formate dehydrogenase, partial [Candidatus Limnocylindrales bacterium]